MFGALTLPLGCPKADAEPEAKPWHVERGEISFYADSLAGNPTANGERYDPSKATCAHRTLPFGTVLKIAVQPAQPTHTADAGAHKASAEPLAATCTVNDRGPYAKDRILDVTSSLAKRLGFHKRGHVEVTLTSVGPRPGAADVAPGQAPAKKKRNVSKTDDGKPDKRKTDERKTDDGKPEH